MRFAFSSRTEQSPQEQHLRAAARDRDPHIAMDATQPLGMLLLDRGEYREAEKCFRTVISGGAALLSRGHRHRRPRLRPLAMHFLAKLLKDQHDERGAETWLRRLIEVGQGNPVPAAMVDLGVLLQSRGESKEARSWWHKAVDSGDDYAASASMYNLGLLAAKGGTYPEAETWYRRAIELGHEYFAPLSMHFLARAVYAQDRQQEAESWYRRGANPAPVTPARSA